MTDAARYATAVSGRPPSVSSTTWTENVENVVNPPRNPTPSASRTSREDQCDAARRPSRNEPTTLMATVVQMRLSVCRVRRESPYRERTPARPAAPTSSVVIGGFLSRPPRGSAEQRAGESSCQLIRDGEVLGLHQAAARRRGGRGAGRVLREGVRP